VSAGGGVKSLYHRRGVSLTRRQFIWSTAASVGSLRGLSGSEGLGWPAILYAQSPDGDGSRLFRHGVASGDPLTDRVILWTRITPPDPASTSPIDVRWRIGSDPTVSRAVAEGTVRAAIDRDFTVKVDAGGLEPGRQYYYVFDSGSERSPIGRTRTLPAGDVDRVRFASLCCSNYPAGYFNVYRCVANRTDLDAVIHVGDYIYEFEDGVYGDGSALLRIPEPRKEAVTLSDYRIRYATYRTDPDLQEAHRVHPFIAVWDDHEITNDTWADGASNHNPERGEGDWPTRKAAAYRAYLEWMPIRESGAAGVHLYRSFRFGSLVDLVMLDTRALRDKQAATTDLAALTDPRRSILGAPQEAWLFEALRSSQRAGTGWRVLGQQVMFSRVVPPGQTVMLSDTWEGYQASRDRVLDLLAAERIRDVAILSGDLHSSWAFDIARNPWDGYDGATGQGSLAVELLAPAISSAPLYSAPGRRELAPLLRALSPHLKFLDGDSRGYILVDITRTQLRGEWYFVPGVLTRSAEETRGAAFVCERGSAHLATA
jgi:alkaline phosphatase D